MSPDQPLSQDTGTSSPPSWLSPVTPIVPDHELIRRVGGGSYGDVWLARTSVGTWRAVKVVFRDRFIDVRPYEREFNGIQKFEPLSRGNEAFMDILQIGRNDAEGYFYYVMELADDAGPMASEKASSASVSSAGGLVGPSYTRSPGSNLIVGFQPDSYVPKTLAKVLFQRGQLPLHECLELGLTLNLGLAHLHRAGLIHRDIKPSNIIFVGGVPKLADIGLVVDMAEARSFVGTEGFIPPEGPNSQQADLYSLGKVLYEASMGKDRKDFPEPFTQLADSADAPELLELNAILLKACAAGPAERYRSAEEMNVDLALLQSGGSVRRQRKITGQLRVVQRGVAIISVLATVIALGWWWQAKQTRRVTELAEQNRARVVQLNIANGVRLMDQDDSAGALLWFAEALPLLAGKRTEDSSHRIRIQQTLNQIPRLLNVFAHPSGVNGAAFSPDEKQIATVCEDGFVRLWEANKQNPITQFGIGAPPIRLRFTGDGQRLIVFTEQEAGDPNVAMGVAVWSLSTGNEAFPAITNLSSCELSPDEQWLVVARSNLVQTYSAQTGKPQAALHGHESRVVNFCFSPDSRQVISASLDRTARRWEVPTGNPIGEPLRHKSPVRSAKFSPDAKRIATTTFRQQQEDRVEIQLWNATTGARIGTPAAGERQVLVLTFDPSGHELLVADTQHIFRAVDGTDAGAELHSWKLNSFPCCSDWSFKHQLALGADNGSLILLDENGNHRLRSSQIHYGRIESVQFDRTGRRLLTASGDGTAKIWDVTLPSPMKSIHLTANIPEVEPGEIRPSLGRESGPVQVPLQDGTVSLFDLDQMRELYRLKIERSNSPPNQSVSAPDGRHWALFQWSRDERLRPVDVDLFSEAQGAMHHAVLEHPAGIFEVRFAPDSKHLFTCARDLVMRVFRVTDGRLERAIKVPRPFAQVIFHPDTKSALLAQNDNRCHWFDLDTEKFIGREFRPPGIRKAEFDPSGQRLAILGYDQSGRIWDVRGEPLTPPFKHGGTVLDLDWSPDGRQVTTAGVSAEARIWDATTGEQILAPLVIGSESVRTARWSPDGRFVVTRSDDQFVRIWDAKSAEPVTPLLRQEGFIRVACLRANNRFIVVCDPNLISACDLHETELPVKDIADYAELLAGRRVSATGTLLALTPVELARLYGALLARAPQLFE
jgi:WD40 repeat protein